MSDVIPNLCSPEHKHVVLGYGSLLSRDSRERHSNIFVKGIPVTVSGFERAWVTRSVQEKQTYVGATPNATCQLNAQLIPTEINPSLKTREKDYRFVEVSINDIHLNISDRVQREIRLETLSTHRFWICETLACEPANDAFPVNQTYIDTCLSGCIEHGGVEEAKAFLKHTQLWHHPRINDRLQPQYPRAAKVEHQHIATIDALLGGANFHIPDDITQKRADS